MGIQFPIGIQKKNRAYFTDANHQPFLWHGDTSWKLFWEFTYEEACTYLKDRAEKGFNVIMVHMLPHRIHKANRNGDLPFLVQGRIDVCNEAYFDHVERILHFANAFHIGFAIAPMWLSTWEQDWHRIYETEGAKAYSTYVAKRFANCKNIVAWIHGGDDDALSHHETIRICAGIFKKYAPNILATYHAGIQGSWGFFGKESWYDFCFAYTYHYDEFLRQMQEATRLCPEKPVILGETHYEGNEKITASVIRKYAYTSCILGSAGHTYGNKDIWMYTMFWSNALFSEASHHMTVLKEMMDAFCISDFTADYEQSRIQNRRCIMPDASSAFLPNAISSDGKTLLAYIDDFRWFTPDMEWSEGCFIDPVSGRRFELRAVMDDIYQIPGKNAGGDYDWILYLKQ